MIIQILDKNPAYVAMIFLNLKYQSHTQDFYSKFESLETNHFKGVLAIYSDFC